MSTTALGAAEPSRWTARLHPIPQPAREVMVIGWHAAFANTPAAGTRVAVFPDVEPGPDHLTVMALVRIEHATALDTITHDGTHETHWGPDPFGIAKTGISWRLVPAHRDGDDRWVIAPGWWAAGGEEAVLSNSVTERALGAPTVVPVYDHDPHTGKRWTS
ncbi:hypothetical protein [Nocardia fluminea]|uniref:hypothetical protein n=1 Tax=Nocardia fluminea TaxID=134984 RepID=UPI000C70EFCA|nr:hypothetical protein [Nocardia fluminea]